MRINGVPQPDQFRALGGKKFGGGGRGRTGCLPLLVTAALLSGGWLHMVAMSAGWTS